jgi:hypothetical protein
MRSQQLETTLEDFLGEVGAHLRAEVAAGAEVPFEVGSRTGRRGGAGTPLYCYRALTGDFIAERDGAIKRLPGHAEAAKLLEGFDGLDRYLASVGVEAGRISRRARARAAINALAEEVFSEQSDFDPRPERVRGALDRLHEATLTGASETALLATLHGVAISSPEVHLTKGLQIARRDALADLPDTTVAAGSARRREEHLLVVHKVGDDDFRTALRRGSAVLADLLRALRLFGDGRIALGGVAWAQVGGGLWTPFALGRAARTRGTLVVTEDQEDELRAFCNLVSRRAPREGEVAWALERFGLGCGREDVLRGISDRMLGMRGRPAADG